MRNKYLKLCILFSPGARINSTHNAGDVHWNTILSLFPNTVICSPEYFVYYKPRILHRWKFFLLCNRALEKFYLQRRIFRSRPNEATTTSFHLYQDLMGTLEYQSGVIEIYLTLTSQPTSLRVLNFGFMKFPSVLDEHCRFHRIIS